jgi:hypothetical protein
MIIKLHIFALFFLLLSNSICFSQKTLQIVYSKYDNLKKYEVFNGDVLEYKLKGQHSYRLNKIVNMQDSMIVFSNDSVIKLNQIKAICIRKSNFVMRLFQSAYITGGGLFFFLNTTNNIINERNPILDPKAALIGASLITTGLLIKQIGVKRIRINHNKTLKIVDLSFQNLSEKKE